MATWQEDWQDEAAGRRNSGRDGMGETALAFRVWTRPAKWFIDRIGAN